LFELRFPESAIVFHPFERDAHGLRVEPRPTHPPLMLDRRKPGVLQNAYVLGDAGQRHVESFGELADRSLAQRETSKNFSPRRVSERKKGGVEPVGMVNHVV